MRYAILLTLLLAGCASFALDPSMLSQERMAHSTDTRSMYLTSTTFAANHNCDDNPSNCCATGYHMCSQYEIVQGSSQVEYSGTGRDTTPYGTTLGALGTVVTGRGASSNVGGADCSGWTDTTGTSYGMYCYINFSGAPLCTTSANCGNSLPVWCCSN